MLPRGRGTIIFTGATASLRGREGFAAFAGAKHGLRALAQSMARELWPKGIHVAHPVIDGAIDTEFIRTNFPDRYALKQQDGILNPDHIADLYWQLHQQPRDAWTQDRKSTRLNSSHSQISYAVFCLKKKKKTTVLCNLQEAQTLTLGISSTLQNTLQLTTYSRLRQT